MPLLWGVGVAHNRTHTMGVYGNYERENRNRNHVWTDGTEGLKRLIRRKWDYSMEYEQELRVEDQELITRNYKEKNTNGQEC
jgi:hypothetical protein